MTRWEQDCSGPSCRWYFAARHTQSDCFEKRNRKGYLFTVGDEEPPRELLAAHASAICGDSLQRDLSVQELLTLVSRMYPVFHFVVEEGSHARHHLPAVLGKWRELLGQRVLRLKDYRRLAEVVVSAIEVNEGRDPDAVARAPVGQDDAVERLRATLLARIAHRFLGWDTAVDLLTT